MARETAKLSSTGFRKGFLLSKPSTKKKSKKPVKVSCALLDVENDRKPLLLVAKDEPSENPVTLNEPLHVVTHENADFGLTQVSTRRKARLVQDVSEDHATLDESIGSTSFLPTKDNKPLIQEVQTSRLVKKSAPSQNGASHDVTLSDRGIANSHSPTPVNRSQLDPGSNSMPPSADLGSVVDDETVSTTCFPQLAQEISCILWKLKRSDQADDAIDQFVSNHLHSDQEWALVWDSILEVIAQDPSDKNPSVRFGVGLLQNGGLDSFVSFLQPTDNDKRSRVLALGAAELVGCFFQSTRETNNFVALTSWVTAALPPLATLTCPTKRSVLSQRCLTAAYDIVATACKTNDGIPVHDVKLSIWDAMSTLDGLLMVQHGWIETSLPSGNLLPSDFSADVTRKQCTLAVLHDWRLIIKENLRILERILMDDEDDVDESRAALTKIVCFQFTGEYINDITVAAGGLSQTLSNDPPKLSAQQILTCMQCAAELLHSIRDNEPSDDVLSWKKERVRALLRGVAAWLGQSRKNLRSLSKASSVQNGGPDTDGFSCEKTIVEQVTDLCISLLRLDTDESVELVLAILSYLWSSSHGLPPDFVHDETSKSSSPTVPASFHLLLDELKHSDKNDSITLEPRERALCFLVARCIEFRGPTLVDELVTRNGWRSSTIEVLAKILSDTVQVDLSGKDTKEVADDCNLSTVAGSAFLGCLGSSRYAQRMVMSSPKLLSGLPIAMVVPRLVSCGDSEEISNDAATAVTAALTQIMMSSLPNKVDKFVHIFVEALLQCDQRMVSTKGGQDTGSSCEENLRSKKLCQKIGGKWRRCLLQNPVCGLHGFASFLTCVANAMFIAPSSTVPLALLGCIVGDEPWLDISTQDESLRVYFAVVSLIRDSLKEIVKAGEKAGKRLDTPKETKEQEEVFSRLSPLLLLRRIPIAYYNTAWRSISDDYRDLVPLLSQLADQLSVRLDISKPPELLNVSFIADERRLAAEIAGRALPFYASPSCSCYHKICAPAFSSTLSLLKVIPGKASLSPNTSLRAARAALYACCHHVPLAQDKEPGEGIMATVSFVLEVLNAQVADFVDDEGIEEDELIQLQTGCIEFVAVCLESTLQRRTRQRGNDKRELLGVVSKVESAYNNNLDKADSPAGTGLLSTVEALSTSCGSVVSFLKTGAPIASQLRVANNGFLSGADCEANIHLSPSARTCLWNAFLVVSQRCREAEGRLNSWASLTAPWVLAWGSYATVDGNLRHPLCMAASLQVVFVLLTRTKSFDCLAGGAKDRTAASVRRAHQWAIASIKTKTEIGGDYARSTMRKAGLKLLLAIITIGQMGDNSNLASWLSPGELGGAFTILRGTANVDADAEVRTLAAYILSTMRVS